MRTKEINMNRVINNDYLGDITVVKHLWMDTRDDGEAKAFAEKFAKDNNLRILSYNIGLNPWYTGKIGRYAVLYRE